MDRINGPGHVNNRWVSQDKNTGRPPTEFTPEWFNGVQEELVGIVESLGWVPDVNDNTQVRRAVAEMVNRRAGSAGASHRNSMINGGMAISSRAAAALNTTPAYSAVDLYACWVSGGAATAGTVMQDTAAPVGRSGMGLKLSGVTLTGAGKLSVRHRIEAANAVKLKNQTVTLQLKAQHDVGASLTYTAVLRKPAVADNFSSAMTVIATADVTVASADSARLVPWPAGIALGDCSAGLEVEIQVSCGAIAGKNFWFTEWQIEEGVTPTSFEFRSKQLEQAAVQRYVTTVAQARVSFYGWAGSVGAPVGTVGIDFPVEMRVTPSIPTISYSLVQAQTPSLGLNTPRGLTFTCLGTVAQGVAQAFNSAAFIVSAEL